MTNLATLVLEADTTGLLRGKKALEDTTKAGGATERAVTGTKDGFDKAGRGATGAKRQIDGFNTTAGRTQGVALAAGRALAGMAAAFGVAASAGAAIGQAREYGSALAEVGTLIEGTAAQTQYLDETSRQLAATYGGTGTAQAQAFYQAISAGASSVEAAGETLDAANRLAIGGVTDVSTAVGVLSTAMNVYANSGMTAADASDAIFVAVRAGVTTVGELSAALGNVLPLAQTLGLTFDETAAATAALTKGGLTTAQAVTGLRASLTSILGPSQEAQELAAQLGINFNAAGLEAQGFGGFMAEVVAKTNGSAELMQTLFGSVEAVGTALAFSGTAGQSYSEILGDMGDKAGATTEAFNKMSEDMQQRLNVVMGELWGLSMSFGSTLLTALVPALELTASVLTLAAENSDALMIGFGLLAFTHIPAIVAGFVATTGSLLGMTGAMTAGAVASGALAAAMNLIPGVALFTGIGLALTGIARGFSESKAAAADFSAAMDGVLSVQNALNVATTAYYNEISRANLEAMLAAAQSARDQVEIALEAAKAELEAASFATNFFGASLGETERMAAARAAIADLATGLIDAEAKLSMAEHAASNFEGRVIEATTATDGAANSLARMGGKLLSITEQEFMLGEQMAVANEQFGYGAGAAALLRDGISASVVQALQLSGVNLSGPIDPAVMRAAELAAQLNVSYQEGYRTATILDRIGGFSSASIVTQIGQITRALGVSTAQAIQLARALPGYSDGGVAGPDGAVSQSRAIAGPVVPDVQIFDAVTPIASGGGGGGGGGSSAAASAINATADALERQISALEDAADPMRKYRRELAELDALMATGRLSDGAYALAVQDLRDEMEAATPEIKTFGSVFKDEMGDAVDLVENLFENGFDGILDTIKKALIDAAKFALANPIQIGVGATGIGGGLGGLGGGGGVLGSFMGSMGGGEWFAPASGLMGGLGSVLSGVSTGFSSGGIMGALSGGWGGITSGITSGLATGGLAGIGSAIGAALPIIGIGAAVFSFFKKKTKLLDEGIRATIDMESAMFESFQKIQTSKFWGLSKKTSYKYEDLSDAESAPFREAVSGVQDSVIEATEALGISTDIFEGFTTQFKISLKGLDDAAKEAAVADALEGLGDEMAAIVLGTAEEVEVLGEGLLRMLGITRTVTEGVDGAYDELMRLSSSLVTVNDVFRDLGFIAYEVSLAGAAGAAAFADLFGSLEGFSTATALYYDQFYSDQEKLENATARLSESLGALGVDVLPTTNAAFRELVETAMLAGDNDLAASLIQLAPAFDTVTDATSALNAELSNLSEDLFSNAFDYRRAVGRANNGIEYSGQSGLSQSDNSNPVSREEFQQSQADMRDLLREIAANTSRGADASENNVIVTGELLT